MDRESLTLQVVSEVMSDIGTSESASANRIRVRTTPQHVREAIARAKDRLRCDHVVQISSADNGNTFEVLYNLTGPHRTVISLWVELARKDPHLPTVHDLLPPAGIYERQIHDLLGIKFDSHPDLRRIILNEEWPEGEYPMRKDWKMDPKKSYGGVPPGVE